GPAAVAVWCPLCPHHRTSPVRGSRWRAITFVVRTRARTACGGKVAPVMVERDRTRPVPLRLSLGLGTGSMLQPLNASMIAVAIVAIGAHFGGLSGTAWVISGLYIATAVVSPAAGRIGVLFGPRRTYLVGLAIIAGASVLGALAPTIGVLVAARVLPGVGTAIRYPTAMPVIRRGIEREGGTAPRAAASVPPAAGRIGVLFGPRRTYLVGLAIIAGASVLGALAPTIGVLVAARVLQGVGTAIQYPTAMTIIRRVIEREGGTARS